MRIEPVFLFDLDGTLVDSVYQHVLAWKEALDAEGIDLSVWRIHRKIGMSGGLFTNQLLRETGFEISPERVKRLGVLHAAAYHRLAGEIRPLPGARELLLWLTEAGIPWAIATSGRMETAAVNLAKLGVDPERPGSFSRRGGASRGADRNRRGRRRQHLGHVGRDAMSRLGGWRPQRRLWARRASSSRRIPGL
jgi:phosphoglycolate phosphatase-like HAD superfamily hydrolase